MEGGSVTFLLEVYNYDLVENDDVRNFREIYSSKNISGNHLNQLMNKQMI